MANKGKSGDLSRINQQQAAYLCGVTARTMRDWTDAPRNADDSYDAAALVKWLVAKTSASGDFDDQRERLAAAQAEKVETENAVRRGELAPVADIVRAVQEHISAARSKLLGMASKLAPQITGLHDTNIIAAGIRAEVAAALTELANYDPSGTGSQSAAGGVAGVEAATDVDDQPVGRPRKAAK